MSNELWSANISQIGADAEMMFSEGVIILFGEPVPPPSQRLHLCTPEARR